jgi:hypothetical protein
MPRACLSALVLFGLLGSLPAAAEGVLRERDVLAASARAVLLS